MKFTVGHSARIITICISVVLVAFFFLFLFYLVPHITDTNMNEGDTAENRKFHIIVVGKAENESFLQQIYAGAQQVSKKYDAVVEVHVPESRAENASLESLLEYASFTNPDGIIAYIGESDSKIDPPVDVKGKLIPLITVVQYHSDIPQVSFIGTNYSELGRKIAVESRNYLNGRGSLLIINTSVNNNPNYSTLMNSLSNSLEEYSGIRTTVSDLGFSHVASSLEGNVKNEIASNTIDLIVCLTTEDTIRAAQSLSEMNRGGKTGIIGFGEGDMVDMYFNRGIITELLSIDPQKMGETAMSELFEYLRYGYANSYIAADVRVRKAGDRR
ncbi:MAG: substrate-binding domain-containing protein [Treponema sp.]|nr:substrate-binding domain-containing protein [Treponema sp.]